MHLSSTKKSQKNLPGCEYQGRCGETSSGHGKLSDGKNLNAIQCQKMRPFRAP